MSNEMWGDTAMVVSGDDGITVEREQARHMVQQAPEDGSSLALMIRHAQSIVRDQKRLVTEAKQIGGLLAGDAFYRFPTGGATVQGASIGLAEALAQAWKAISYQVNIVHIEHLATGGRRIHLRARVMDMHSLVLSEVEQVVTTSAPPGKFGAKEDQAERWHTMQTQAATSKIVRNVILRVLPDWFVNAGLQAAYAQDAQNATAGKSLPEARTNAVDVLGKRGLTREEMEKYTATPVDLWAVPQLAMLGELNRDLGRGTVSIEQVRANFAATTTPAENGKTSLGLKKKAEPEKEPVAS